MSPSARATGATGWSELLDTLEERLRAWRAAASGAPPPEALTWPDLEPLPPGLEVRARSLLSCYLEVEAGMVQRHEAIHEAMRTRVQQAPATARRATGTPLFVDRRG